MSTFADWPLARAAMEYWMGHRPSEDGAPASDLLEIDPEWGEPRYPTDIYDRPNLYTSYFQHIPELMRVLRSIRGKPDAQVAIYRAQKTGAGLNTGDWVTLSKGYAETDLGLEPEGRSVETYHVPAHTVRYAGDDLMEWGYWGPPVSGRTASLTAAAQDNDHSDSVMIALRPSPAQREAFAAMRVCTEDVDDLHLTLLYLGTTEEAGGEMGRERLFRACYGTALGTTRAVTGKANGFGWFLNDDAHVLISLWDMPYLSEFRERLVEQCRLHGVPLRTEDHGFTPHLTLSYRDPGDGERGIPTLPAEAGQETTFDAIWLVWGEDWQEIPLA